MSDVHDVEHHLHHIDNHHPPRGDDDIDISALHDLLDDVNEHLTALNERLYDLANDVRARVDDLIADLNRNRPDDDPSTNRPVDNGPDGGVHPPGDRWRDG